MPALQARACAFGRVRLGRVGGVEAVAFTMCVGMHTHCKYKRGYTQGGGADTGVDALKEGQGHCSCEGGHAPPPPPSPQPLPIPGTSCYTAFVMMVAEAVTVEKHTALGASASRRLRSARWAASVVGGSVHTTRTTCVPTNCGATAHAHSRCACGGRGSGGGLRAHHAHYLRADQLRGHSTCTPMVRVRG